MKFWIKTLFIVITILAVILTAAYIFLVFKGKDLFVKQLENLTHKKVSINYLGLRPLFNLEIKKLEIEGLLRVDTLRLSPSILGLLTGSIAFNNIEAIRPEFTYVKTPSGIIGGESPVVMAIAHKKKQPRLIFKRIIIKDGRVSFIDHAVGPDGINLIIKEVNFKLTNLYVFPAAVVTNFELRGRIPWQKGRVEGKIEADGWVNIFKKSMEATLRITDIDGIYLYPYYSKWVDLERARIEKANLNFTSNIHGLNNNVTAECHLELTDIVRKQLLPEESEDKASKITNAVLDMFRILNQGKIVLDFTIRTKMDRPEFGFGNVKTAVEDKLTQARKAGGFKAKDVLLLPGNILQGTAKGATDISKALFDGTIAIGRELIRAADAAFKKEKK